MTNDVREQAAAARLIADLRAAKIELLSAQCAADRVRLQYSIKDIVSIGERETLDRAIASVRSLHKFFSQIEAQLPPAEERSRATNPVPLSPR